MGSCCENKACEVDALKEKHSSVLKTVMVINLAMFAIEVVFGLRASSLALLGDSLDMFGDASVYALSLYALSRIHLRPTVTIIKGIIMIIGAAAILAGVVVKYWTGNVPTYEIMSWVGLLALVANTICFAMLYRFKSDDINMKSVWLCSRNDLVANTSVILAAGLVWYFNSAVPDLVVGGAIAALFFQSSIEVLRDGFSARKAADGKAVRNATHA
jgi:Co/Zn/Cd efflux system component